MSKTTEHIASLAERLFSKCPECFSPAEYITLVDVYYDIGRGYVQHFYRCDKCGSKFMDTLYSVSRYVEGPDVIIDITI